LGAPPNVPTKCPNGDKMPVRSRVRCNGRYLPALAHGEGAPILVGILKWAASSPLDHAS
jgi:hypothetical protein